MSDRSPSFRSLIGDLVRRRVFRTAALYAGLAIVLVEATEALVVPLDLPLRAVTLVAWAAILGFPIAVGLAWTYDVTPRGIVRTSADSDAERRRRALSTRVGFRLTLTGLAAAAVGAGTWTVLEPFLPDVREAPDVAAAELPRGTVLVGSVSADGLDDVTTERVRVLLVQRLSAEPGLLPLDPREVDEGAATDATSDAVALGAEQVLGVRLEALSDSAAADNDVRLVAELTPLAGGEARVVSLEGRSDDLVSLVDRLAVALSEASGAEALATSEQGIADSPGDAASPDSGAADPGAGS